MASSERAPEFGRAATDYDRYRAGFPDRLFDELWRRLPQLTTQAVVVDLGCGTGSLALGFAARSLSVTGIDRDAALLAVARRRAETQGLPARFVSGVAEALPLDDHSVDLLSCGQCWHWFDRPRAAREIRRVLRPGGTLVIAHFDWLPIGENVVSQTEALIRAHNPAWTFYGGNGIYAPWFDDLALAGYQQLESFSFDHDQRYSHEAWRGRVRANSGVGATLDAAAVARFDEALAKLLAARFPDPLAVPHRVFALLGRTPLRE